MGARLGALGALGALALALTPLLAAGAGAPLLAGSSPTAQPRWGGDGDWGGAGRRGLRQEPLDPHLPAAPAGPKDDPFADVRPPGLAAQPAPATAPANGTAPFEGRAAPANASSSAAQGAAGEAAAAAEPADIGPVVPVPEVAPGEAESAEAEAAEGRLQADQMPSETDLEEILEGDFPSEEEADLEKREALGILLMLTVLFTILLLGFVAEHFHLTWLSEAAIGLLSGALVGMLAKFAAHDEVFKETVKFDVEIFFLGLLPPIMFEAGYAVSPEFGRTDRFLSFPSGGN